MKVILFLFFMFQFSHESFAQNCQLSVNANNYQGTLQNTIQTDTHSISLNRHNNGSDCENYRIYFSTGGANNYNRQASNGNGSIPYNLYRDNGLNSVLKDYQAAGNGEYLSVSLPYKDVDYSFPFYVKLVDLNSVFSAGPGYFGDQIQAHIYVVKSNGSLEYQTTGYFNFQFIIPRYAELSLVSTGAPHDPSQTTYLLDFGNLTSNESKSLSLSIKGNVGFGIYMASQNGSNLKNGTALIPYQVKVSYTNYISLNNPGQNYYIMQRNSGTSPNSESYPVTVKIGQIPNNPKTGDYQDVITITVQAW